MHRRLKNIVAVWFTLQILVPFSAPLQACDLNDFLGTHEHSSPTSSRSSTTPATNEAESEVNSFVSPMAVSSLRISTNLAIVRHISTSGPLMSTFDLSPAPQVQQTVLRL